MADRLDIEATGFEFLSAIDQAAAKLERPTELMQKIGGTLQEAVALRFSTKSDPAGHPWLPLRPSTLRQKNGFGSLLVGGGKQANPKKGSDERMRDTLGYNAGDDFVEVGFASKHAIYHELGTQRMPRRQLLTDDPIAGTLGAQDQADVLADIEAFLSRLGLS